MGQQQLLLIIVGILIVGVAIAVGLTQFGANNSELNRDGVTSSLLDIAANAYQYKIRPVTLGGGSHSYENYMIPVKLAANDFGQYSIVGSPTPTMVKLEGKSTLNPSWIADCTIDDTGRTVISYAGW